MHADWVQAVSGLVSRWHSTAVIDSRRQVQGRVGLVRDHQQSLVRQCGPGGAARAAPLRRVGRLSRPAASRGRWPEPRTWRLSVITVFLQEVKGLLD